MWFAESICWNSYLFPALWVILRLICSGIWISRVTSLYRSNLNKFYRVLLFIYSLPVFSSNFFWHFHSFHFVKFVDVDNYNEEAYKFCDKYEQLLLCSWFRKFSRVTWSEQKFHLDETNFSSSYNVNEFQKSVEG